MTHTFPKRKMLEFQSQIHFLKKCSRGSKSALIRSGITTIILWNSFCSKPVFAGLAFSFVIPQCYRRNCTEWHVTGIHTG